MIKPLGGAAGLGAVRVATSGDLQVLAQAYRQGLQRLAPGLMSYPHAAIDLPPFAPEQVRLLSSLLLAVPTAPGRQAGEGGGSWLCTLDCRYLWRCPCRVSSRCR